MTTHLHLVSKLRNVNLYINSPYVSMVWCLINYKEAQLYILPCLTSPHVVAAKPSVGPTHLKRLPNLCPNTVGLVVLAMRITRPNRYDLRFVRTTYTRWPAQITAFLRLPHNPSPDYLVLLRPNSLTQHFVRKRLSIYISPWIKRITYHYCTQQLSVCISTRSEIMDQTWAETVKLQRELQW
jgi:hypothetical protein